VKNLLIIDDDEDIRFIVKMILERSGKYLVHEAETAAAGKIKTEKLQPDILLLDYLLPDTRGLDLLKDLQLNSMLDKTQTVILTARRDADLESEFIQAGADAVLHKPFDPEALQKILESSLES